MKASLIISNYNKASILPILFQSILKQDLSKFEIIFVDDASTDQSVDIIKDYPINLIQVETNQGPAYCRNLGVNNSQGEILIFCDSDIKLKENSLKELLIPFQDKTVASVTAKNIYPPLSTHLAGHFWILEDIEVRHHAKIKTGESRWWSTTLGAIRKDVLLSIGGFDEKFKAADMEDTELGQRIPKNQKMYHQETSQFQHNYSSLGIILIKAFRRAFQVSYYQINLKGSPYFHFHRKIGYLLSLVWVLCLILSIFSLAIFFIPLLFITVVKLGFHHYFYKNVFKWRMKRFIPVFFIYNIFMGLSASFGFGIGLCLNSMDKIRIFLSPKIS